MEPLEINDQWTIPAAELWFKTSSASGPGGQHVNRTSSRVTLYWDLSNASSITEEQRQTLKTALASRMRKDGAVWLSCESSRSQHANRAEARERLKNLIVEALKPKKKRKPTKISKAAIKRRLKEKKRRADLKATRGKVRYED